MTGKRKLKKLLNINTKEKKSLRVVFIHVVFPLHRVVFFVLYSYCIMCCIACVLLTSLCCMCGVKNWCVVMFWHFPSFIFVLYFSCCIFMLYILCCNFVVYFFVFDDDDVTGIQATKACPKYEAVWARTGPLLIQPGSKLRQWPTQR